MSSTSFVLGTSTVPCGKQGDWSVEEFVITQGEADLNNLRCSMNRRHMFRLSAGRYKRLMHSRRGVVMSNTPMEIHSNYEALHAATGSVLINGLGMGMLLEAVLAKPDVTAVRVIELEADVIALVGPHFAHDPRVTIVHADAYTYSPAKGEVFDFVWHDIWDDITPDNLKHMKRLTSKYRKPRSKAQAVWSRSMIEALYGR